LFFGFSLGFTADQSIFSIFGSFIFELELSDGEAALIILDCNYSF
jgi:hypothetical protein